jgi:hypothetical protein
VLLVVLLLLLLLLLLLVAQLHLHVHVLLGVNVRLSDGVIAVGRIVLQRRVLIHFNVQERFLLFRAGGDRSVTVCRFGRAVHLVGAAVALLRLLPLWRSPDQADNQEDEAGQEDARPHDRQGDGRRVRH